MSKWTPRLRSGQRKELLLSPRLRPADVLSALEVHGEFHFGVLGLVPRETENVARTDVGDGDAVPGEALGLPYVARGAVSEHVGEVGEDDKAALLRDVHRSHRIRLQAHPILAALGGLQYIPVTGGDDSERDSVRPGVSAGDQIIAFEAAREATQPRLLAVWRDAQMDGIHFFGRSGYADRRTTRRRGQRFDGELMVEAKVDIDLGLFCFFCHALFCHASTRS